MWAKKTIDDNGQMKWLPLKQHLIDTSFVIRTLYNIYLSEGQREIIRESIHGDNDTAQKLVSFLGLSHDYGKLSASFQTQKSYNHSKELDDELLEKLIRQGYWPDSNYSLANTKYSPHALAGEALLEHYGVNVSVAGLIGGHHGKPIDKRKTVKEQIERAGYLDNYYVKEDKNNIIHKKWDAKQKSFFNWILKKSHYEDVKDIPTIDSIAAQVILEGLLIMSDWIASCSEYFPLFDMDQTEPTDKQRLEHGFRKWFETPEWMPQINSDAKKYYEERFGFQPRKFQEKIYGVMNSTTHPGLVIIESGMGSGKTEAALATAEQMASKDKSDGVFFALPTQATSNSMFTRVKDWLSKVSEDDENIHSIQLVHGKAALNNDFKKLPDQPNIYDEDDKGVISNQWFLGSKKSMLDSFVVGTIDQFLLVALKKKHLSLRHLGFSKKVVICDEIHSNDAYMSEYMNRALEWMGHYKVPVILLSATLSKQKRNDLITSYTGSRDFESSNVLSYPLVTYTDGKSVNYIDDFPKEASQNIIVNKLSEEHLLTKVEELLADGGVLGIIVNTVKRAQKLAKLFISKYGEDKVELLHSSFISTQRTQKERKLVKNIGKNGDRPKLKIVIGTQVLEQSLDIDFDCLITDLAPMDLILQRVGRLQRHDIKRPDKLMNPTLYVLNAKEDDSLESGSKAIYGEYLLEKTKDYLPVSITLPKDIPELVSKVYDSDNDSSKYSEAKKDYDNLLGRKRQAAHHYILDEYEYCKDGLIGWLENVSSSDAKGLAQVRDGNTSIEVIMVKKKVNGNYTYLDNDKDVGDVSDYEVAKDLAKETIKLPNVFSKPWMIDDTINYLEKYTIDHFSDWISQPMLKGSLIIALNKNNQFSVNEGSILTYDSNLGLYFEKGDESE